MTKNSYRFQFGSKQVADFTKHPSSFEAKVDKGLSIMFYILW